MFVKHEKFMDVCIEVRHITPSSDGIKIYGTFWNLGQSGKSFPIGSDLKLKIPFDEVSQWKQCVDASEDLRVADWQELKA